MFNISALVMLTVLNLVALVQIAANILAPRRIQPGPVFGAATVCLATSLTGLAMAILIPSPIVGIACVTAAALVNLLAVLTTSVDHISDPQSTQALRALRGLARLAIVGAPHEAVLAGVPNRHHNHNKPPKHHTMPALLAVRANPTNGPIPTRITADPLPKLLAAASQSAHTAPRAKQPTRPSAPVPTRKPSLAPRQNFIVPHRPNRLPTSSMAFLLSVDPEHEPDIFADSRSRVSELPALAHRVSLLANDPGRPSLNPQSSSVWPTTFSSPDPAWTTSYGRLPAFAPGV
jgi:hypothetical protein